MNKIVKIKEKNLASCKLPGNFLYSKKDTYFFADSFCHSIILNHEKYVKENQNERRLFLNVEQHILNALEACKESTTPPAILTVNSYIKSEYIEERLNSKYTYIEHDEDFVSKHSEPIYLNVTTEDFDPIIDGLIKARTDLFPCPNEVLVYIFNPEDYKIDNLLPIITVARSRRIFITVYIEDKDKFIETYGAETFDLIKENAKIIFNSDYDNIQSVTIFKSNGKEKTIKYKHDFEVL